SALIVSELAKLYEEMQNYSDAIKLIERNLAKFPNSIISDELKRRLQNLKRPVLTLKLSDHLIPGKASKFTVTHRLVSAVAMRITPITINSFLNKEADDLTGNDRLRPLTKNFHFETYKQNGIKQDILPLEGLDAGIYQVSMQYSGADNSPYDLDDHYLCISNQDYVLRRLSERKLEFYFFERESGKPLSSQRIELKRRNPGSDQFETIDSFLTDQQGFVEFEHFETDELYLVSQRNSDILISQFNLQDFPISRYTNQIVVNKRSFTSPDTLSFYMYTNSPSRINTVYIESKALGRIDSIRVSSDQSGMSAGRFFLDEVFAEGAYSLVCDDASYPFSISKSEKAPRSLILNLDKTDYKAGDQLTINGTVENYNPFDDSKQKIDFCFYQQEPDQRLLLKQKIAADDRGRFTITIPTSKESKSYHVEAKLRVKSKDLLSGHLDFNLADHSYKLFVETDETITQKQSYLVKIGSENNLGQSESISGELRFYRLPTRLEKITAGVVPAGARLVYKQTAQTNKEIKVENWRWSMGNYLLVFTTKKEQQTITKHIILVDQATEKLNSLSRSLIYYNPDNNGDKLELWVGSALKDVDAWIEFRNRFGQKRSYVRLNEAMRKLEFKRSLLNGYNQVSLFFVKHDRFYSSSTSIRRNAQLIKLKPEVYKPGKTIAVENYKGNSYQLVYNFIPAFSLRKQNDSYLNWDFAKKKQTDSDNGADVLPIISLQTDQLNWFAYSAQDQSSYRLLSTAAEISSEKTERSDKQSISYLNRIKTGSNQFLKLPEESGLWQMQLLVTDKT
ncbi:MAG: hypothetical protein KDD94_12035, partial [Calditrichaeota bacterium]|nr:hypothetical protein [Calditrichota bacterium]